MVCVPGWSGAFQFHHIPGVHLHRPGQDGQEWVHGVQEVQGLPQAARETWGQVSQTQNSRTLLWDSQESIGAPIHLELDIISTEVIFLICCRYAAQCIILPPPPSNSKVKSVSAKVRTDSETDGLGRSIGESKLPRLEVKCLHVFCWWFNVFSWCRISCSSSICFAGWSGWEGSSGKILAHLKFWYSQSLKYLSSILDNLMLN